MRIEPLYGTQYKRPARAHFFRTWVRAAFFLVITIVALKYCIHGYFWLMAHSGDWVLRLTIPK